MRSILLFIALAIAPALDAACATGVSQVWVPGHWQVSGCSSVWIAGGYQVQERVVCVAPPPVWVAEREVWDGGRCLRYPGYWSNQPCPSPMVVVYQQPAPVVCAAPVYYQPAPVYYEPTPVYYEPAPV